MLVAPVLLLLAKGEPCLLALPAVDTEGDDYLGILGYAEWRLAAQRLAGAGRGLDRGLVLAGKHIRARLHGLRVDRLVGLVTDIERKITVLYDELYVVFADFDFMSSKNLSFSWSRW